MMYEIRKAENMLFNFDSSFFLEKKDTPGLCILAMYATILLIIHKDLIK